MVVAPGSTYGSRHATSGAKLANSPWLPHAPCSNNNTATKPIMQHATRHRREASAHRATLHARSRPQPPYQLSATGHAVQTARARSNRGAGRVRGEAAAARAEAASAKREAVEASVARRAQRQQQEAGCKRVNPEVHLHKAMAGWLRGRRVVPYPKEKCFSRSPPRLAPDVLERRLLWRPAPI